MRKVTNFDHLDKRQPTEIEVNSPADVDSFARRELPQKQTWGGVPIPFSAEDGAKFHRAMFGNQEKVKP